MNKRIVILSMLVFCLAGGVILLSTSSAVKGQSQAIADEADSYREPFTRIDKKARALRGSDETPIRELTDEIVRLFAGSSAAASAGALKDRVVRSEISYRDGKSEGIPEGNVVKVVNDLVKEFDAPNYAKTDAKEVNDIRMAMFPFMPHLIDQESRKGSKKEKGKMSPTEALYVTLHLLFQKLHNEEYQMTPGEHRALVADRQKRQRADATADRADANFTKAENSARQKEMASIVARKHSMMSPADEFNLANKSLDTLGIER